MNFPILSQEEILELLDIVKNSSNEDEKKRAKNKIVQSSNRLVHSIAKKYKRGNNLDDIIQEGRIGVLKAIEKYDRSKGTKFSTYAVTWIKQSIGMYCNSKSRLVRLPAHAEGVNRKISQLTEAHKVKTGKQISREEMLKNISDSTSIVDATVRAAIPVLSIDSPIGESSSTLGDKLASHDLSPVETLERKELLTIAKKVFNSLSPKEKEILKLRFGLDSNEE